MPWPDVWRTPVPRPGNIGQVPASATAIQPAAGNISQILENQFPQVEATVSGHQQAPSRMTRLEFHILEFTGGL